MAVVKAMGACVRSEGEKFAVVFSFSTSPSWPSPDHRSSPLDDTETSSPRKETPCFPKGRQSKVHYSSCVFVCTCFFFQRNRGKKGTVSIELTPSSAQRSIKGLSFILAAVCFSENNPSPPPLSQQI